MNTTDKKEHETGTFKNDILSTVGKCNDLYIMNTNSTTNSNKTLSSPCKITEQNGTEITWNIQTIAQSSNYYDLIKNLEIWSAELQEMEKLFQNQAQEMILRDFKIMNNHSFLQNLMMAVTESTYQHDNMDILLNLIDRDLGILEKSVSCLETITPSKAITQKDIPSGYIDCHNFYNNLKRQELFYGIYEYFALNENYKDHFLEMERCLEDLDLNKPGALVVKLMRINWSMQNRMRNQLCEMEKLCSYIADNTTKIYAKAELCRNSYQYNRK